LRNQKEFETRTRWTSEQLTGRIGHYEALPTSLTPADLHKVAVALLPDASEQTIEALVVYAQASTKYLAGIRHAVDRAGFIARKEGREKIQFADVKRALKEAVIPSDTAFANAVGATNNPARKRAARVFATPLQPASRALESPLPVERIPGRGVRPATTGAVEETELVHA
jgi:histone H3/H4